VTQSEQAGLLRDGSTGLTTDQYKPAKIYDPTSLEAWFSGQNREDGA